MEPAGSQLLSWIRKGSCLVPPGGIITDWDLKTNIDGIYAAGDQLYASDCCGTKCKDLLTEGLDLLAQYMRMERL